MGVKDPFYLRLDLFYFLIYLEMIEISSIIT